MRGWRKPPNELIFIGHFNDFDRDLLMERLKSLDAVCHSNSADIRSVLQQIVPTYHPGTDTQPQQEPETERGVLTAGAV